MKSGKGKAISAFPFKAFTKELKVLIKEASIMPLTALQLDAFLGTLAIIARMWISEATLDGIIEDERLTVQTYMMRMIGLLQLVATDKGKAELNRFSSTLKN